jgi:hypothetical protein
MERPTCKTCPYWDCTDSEFATASGTCNRYAPMPIRSGDDPLVWSTTIDDDFCGEHPSFPAYIASLKPAESSGNSVLDNLLKTVEKY